MSKIKQNKMRKKSKICKKSLFDNKVNTHLSNNIDYFILETESQLKA